MKKFITYFFIIILSVIVFFLVFDYNSGMNPNTYYQVYLDSELIGTIKSKEELEDYINNQANVIRENIKEYNLKLEAINTFQKYESSIINQNYSPLDKVNYLISNRDSYNFTDLDIENLNFYKKEKLYNYNFTEINEMKEYVVKNDIYDHVDEVYTPNGIEIKKTYTYHNNIMDVKEIYKEIISKKSCTISGYKFIIKSHLHDLNYDYI